MREANGLAKVSKILTKPISIATFKEVLFKTIEDKRKENHADQLIADTLNELLDRSAVTTAFQPRVRAEDFSRTGARFFAERLMCIKVMISGQSSGSAKISLSWIV